MRLLGASGLRSLIHRVSPISVQQRELEKILRVLRVRINRLIHLMVWRSPAVTVYAFDFPQFL